MALETDVTTTGPDARQPIADTGSLSEHEAEFHGQPRVSERRGTPRHEVDRAEPSVQPDADAAARPVVAPESDGDEPTAAELATNPNLRYEKPRHRAQKDKARSEDVPRIKELTRKLREAEERIEVLSKSTGNGHPPVAVASVPRSSVPPASEPAPGRSVLAFTETEPTLEQFGKETDPYAAWTRALARYDRRKEQFEADQQKAEETRKQREADTEAEWSRLQTDFGTRLQTYIAANPGHPEKVRGMMAAYGGDLQLPMVPYRVILQVDNGPAILDHLADHPEQLAEVIALWDGKPVTEQNVALATRWLTSRVAAGTTGAAPTPPPVPRTPKPPTPVRTGPMKTGQELPGDGASLREHEEYYHPRTRR